MMSAQYSIISLLLFLMSCNDSILSGQKNKLVKPATKAIPPEILDKVISDNSLPMLVLRVKDTDCIECIRLELENYKKVSQALNGKVVILTRFSNERALRILLGEFSINSPVINLSDMLLDNDYEKAGKPYFFVVMQDASLSYFYVSNLDNPVAFSKYQNVVISHFDLP